MGNPFALAVEPRPSQRAYSQGQGRGGLTTRLFAALVVSAPLQRARSILMVLVFFCLTCTLSYGDATFCPRLGTFVNQCALVVPSSLPTSLPIE